MFQKKEKVRGYNQSKLLAQYVSNKVGVPLIDITEKTKDNVNQASLHYADRMKNVQDVYSINKEHRKDIKDKSILIIDDIMTTGATSNEISRILIEAHARECYVLTLCHGRLDTIPTDIIDTETLWLG